MQKEVRVGDIVYDCQALDDDFNKRRLSMSEIGKNRGSKTRTIEIALKKCGIPKRWDARVLKTSEMYKDKATLEYWIGKKKNASQIGRIFGQDASTILWWIRRHRIAYDAKKSGYEWMDHDSAVRAAAKDKRRAQKEADRIATLKFPGRGKGRPVLLKSRLKHSVSGVFSGKKSATPEELMLCSVLEELGFRFRSETPLAFFQNGKYITAHRVDYYLPIGSVNKEHSVIIALDGVWHHKAKPGIEKRDRLLNTVAQHSGIIVARLWNDEIDRKDREKNLRHVAQLLGAVARCKPGLVRFHVDTSDIHSVQVTDRLERTASTIGSPRIQCKIVTKKNLPKIHDTIERGEYIDLTKATA